MRTRVSILILSSFFFFTAPAFVGSPVAAFTAPMFPDCTSPQGAIKAQYDTGIHGIVGDTSEHQGKDAVYQLTGDAITQCFCSTDNNGIQTNWWKASSLTEEDTAILQKEGWTLIPDGSLWGLNATAYLAKNNSFSCAQASNNSGGSSGGSSGSSSSSNNSSGNSTGNSSASNDPARIGGDVLGLASTGNISVIMLICAIGSLLITLGLLLRKKKS